MTTSFIYQASPVRVLFGHGTISRLGEEAERLGVRRVLVLSTPHQEDLARRVARVLGNLSVGIFTEAAMHTPVEITERAADFARKVEADATVAVGGGSTTGLGKAIARRLLQRQIVVPTTYAGSEMTSILGETEGGRKVTVRDPALFPASVIYDVELTYGLPAVRGIGSDLDDGFLIHAGAEYRCEVSHALGAAIMDRRTRIENGDFLEEIPGLPGRFRLKRSIVVSSALVAAKVLTGYGVNDRGVWQPIDGAPAELR